MPATVLLHASLLMAATVLRPVLRSVARPALRLGGEWAGNCVEYTDSGSARSEVLTSETWEPTEQGGRSIHRRTLHVLPEQTASHSILPPACSGSIELRYGAGMLDPDVLNARAWVLDAVRDGSWRCETIFDGLGGDRPLEVKDAFDCPKERTRVECSFDPASGHLLMPLRVWQERCWSTSPSADLQEPSHLDAAWISSVVGLRCFGHGAVDGAPVAGVAPGGGVVLVAQPGLLEIRMTSGKGSRNSFREVVVRRTWAGSAAGSSVFAEVEALDDTTQEN